MPHRPDREVLYFVKSPRLRQNPPAWEVKTLRSSFNCELSLEIHLSQGRDNSVSDFLASGYEGALRIARRRHDLIPIVVTDPRELTLPDVGIIEMEDCETGEVAVVDTGSKAVRRRFALRAIAAREDRETLFRRMDTDFIDVMTDRSYVEPLMRFFHKREARR